MHALLSNRLRQFQQKFWYYCQHTHLHGLRYVTPERSIFIRITWMIIFCLFFIAMTLIFVSIIDSYRYSSVSFLTDTTYLNWNTTFPAVTVCPESGLDLDMVGKYRYDLRDNIATVEFFLSEMLFFSGNCFSCQNQCYSCPKINISETVKKLKLPCNKILGECTWNGESFHCCDKFLPLETEFGVCFSINSLHTSHDIGDLDLLVNRKKGAGSLFVQNLEDIRVFIHAPEEVPYSNHDIQFQKYIFVGEVYEFLFNVIEIDNDHQVLQLPIYRRECRFPWEIPKGLKVHKYYSYSSCVVQCRAEYQIKLCNCSHHFMPFYNKVQFCDMNGIKCLDDHFEDLNRLHAENSQNPGLFCDCLPSCTEPEYNMVLTRKKNNQFPGGVHVRMQNTPTMRFKRVVVKTTLDLVVGLGGASGLFIGASVFSIVELIYLFIIRK